MRSRPSGGSEAGVRAVHTSVNKKGEQGDQEFYGFGDCHYYVIKFKLHQLLHGHAYMPGPTPATTDNHTIQVGFRV